MSFPERGGDGEAGGSLVDGATRQVHFLVRRANVNYGVIS